MAMNLIHLMRHRYLLIPVTLALTGYLASCAVSGFDSPSVVNHNSTVAEPASAVTSGEPDPILPQAIVSQTDVGDRVDTSLVEPAQSPRRHTLWLWQERADPSDPPLCFDDPMQQYQHGSEACLTMPYVEGLTWQYQSTVNAPSDLSEEPEPADLWARLRRGFAIPSRSHPRVDANLEWCRRHPRYLDRIAKRASRYLYWITEAVEQRGMPSEIALLPVVESAFQPFAYSHGRAAGLWQFIPETGRLFGLKQNWWYDGRRDVAASTEAALTYLSRLQGRFDGDWLLALAAYNSGEGMVASAIRRNKRRGKPTDFWSLALPAETRDYVPKLLAIVALVAHPETYGIELAAIPNEPYLTKVKLDSQIDLALAAELAEMSLEELYLLNPGFNRWATAPDGPHDLMLPVDNVETFLQNLEELPETARITWRRHHVRRGETLIKIASRYNTDVEAIQKVNQIRGHTIRAGQNLMVAVSSKNASNYTLSAGQRLLRLQNKPRRGAGQKAIHRVQRGDTLWDISRKFDVSVSRLAKWNGLAPKDTLRPGQKLVVWLKGGSRPAQTAFSPHAHRLVTRKIRYRVRRGESLALIARKFNVTVDNLVQWNQIERPSYLRPGEQITLYVNVTEQAGI